MVVNYIKHYRVQPNTEETTDDLFTTDHDQGDEELVWLVQQTNLNVPLAVMECATADEDVATCTTFQKSPNQSQELQDVVM